MKILERNYRCSGGEIDLVCADRGELVFCEVKTRSTGRWGDPEEAVGWAKQRRYRLLAASWIEERRPGSAQVRFDVVSVIVGPQVPEIVHIPDAF